MCYNKQSPRSLAESEAMAKAVGRRGRDVIAQGPPAARGWAFFVRPSFPRNHRRLHLGSARHRLRQQGRACRDSGSDVDWDLAFVGKEQSRQMLKSPSGGT